MELIFLLFVLSVLTKVQGSNLNFDNAFDEEKPDERPKVYQASEPVRGIGISFGGSSSENTTSSIPMGFPINTNTVESEFFNLPREQTSAPVFISYNIPPPPLSYPYPPVPNSAQGAMPSPFPIYHHRGQPVRNILLPPQIVVPSGTSRFPAQISSAPLLAPASITYPVLNLIPLNLPPNLPAAIRDYLLSESNYYNFKKPIRYELVRKMIACIAQNDFASYNANEKEFKSEFNHSYEGLNRGKQKFSFLHHYIIYFGATDFIEIIKRDPKTSFKDLELLKAFYNLINTKPIEIVSTIFNECRWLQVEDQENVRKLVERKYPNLHDFDHLYSIPIPKNDKLDFLQSSIPIDEKRIAKLLVRHQDSSTNRLAHFSLKNLVSIPKNYPEFFKCLPDASKLIVGKVAVLNDDIDALIRLVQLDGNVLLMNFKNSHSTLFDLALEKKKMKIIPLMIRLVPELAVAPKPDGNDSIYKSLIVEDNLEMIKCFEQNGFSSEAKVHEGKNAIQVAFELGVPRLIAHFVDSFGRNKVLGYLKEIYGSEEKIIDYATNKFNAMLVEILRSKLMI